MVSVKKNAETIKLFAQLSARIDTLIADLVTTIDKEVEQTIAATRRIDHLAASDKPSSDPV